MGIRFTRVSSDVRQYIRTFVATQKKENQAIKSSREKI
jgi:hypothetical protein